MRASFWISSDVTQLFHCACVHCATYTTKGLGWDWHKISPIKITLSLAGKLKLWGKMATSEASLMNKSFG